MAVYRPMLTLVNTFPCFAHDEVCAAFVPVERRTKDKLRGVGAELQFAIGELDRHEFSVTVEQQGGDALVFGLGEIGKGGMAQTSSVICMDSPPP